MRATTREPSIGQSIEVRRDRPWSGDCGRCHPCRFGFSCSARRTRHDGIGARRCAAPSTRRRSPRPDCAGRARTVAPRAGDRLPHASRPAVHRGERAVGAHRAGVHAAGLDAARDRARSGAGPDPRAARTALRARAHRQEAGRRPPCGRDAAAEPLDRRSRDADGVVPRHRCDADRARPPDRHVDSAAGGRSPRRSSPWPTGSASASSTGHGAAWRRSAPMATPSAGRRSATTRSCSSASGRCARRT